MNTVLRIGDALVNVYDIRSIADVTANPMVVTMSDGVTTFNIPNVAGAGFALLQLYLKVVNT